MSDCVKTKKEINFKSIKTLNPMIFVFEKGQ